MTTRLVALLLAVGALVLFALQNTSPALPLVFLGVQTQALPIAVWLVGAIAAGAITALLLAGLMDLAGGRSPANPRSGWTQPQGDKPPRPDRWQPPKKAPTAQPAEKAAPQRDRSAAETDWETFRSPENWENWGERPDPNEPPPRRPPRSRREREQYQVEDSLNELEEGWQDWRDDESPKGASVVEDSLDELEEGWDDWPESADVAEESIDEYAEPRDYEAPASPKRVYQSGSIYSYGYRGEEETGSRNQAEDGESDTAAETFSGRVGEDGVYEADYRVIIPPYRNLDESSDEDWSERDRP
ncbi:MAG: hypothetical protein F6K04_14670 [Leptolyngbya sp. SIO4C5]|nr:hypothetical protein [Leptolyngbya sp. SIO4C5]